MHVYHDVGPAEVTGPSFLIASPPGPDLYHPHCSDNIQHKNKAKNAVHTHTCLYGNALLKIQSCFL